MATLWRLITDRVTVGRPLWLILLLIVLPPVVIFSYKSLAGLGKARRLMAVGLRVAVITLIVLALAEVQSVRTSDKLAALFVIDTSESIPVEMRRATYQYVTKASKKRRSDDLAGVVVFGRDASVEAPPAPTEVNLELGLESPIDPRNTQNTDIGAAIKLALATFPEDSARRIVLVSDGNQNRGNALEQALQAKKLGVPIDVLPIDYFYDREVLVEKIALPPDVKKGETVNINVVLRAGEKTKGTLQLFQKDGEGRNVAVPGHEQPQPIELERGVNVKTIKQLITEPSFYTFVAEFVPEAGSGDRRAINNTADGFTYARGTAQVLLIEGVRGEHSELVRALREQKIEVKVLVAPSGIEGAGEEAAAAAGDPLPDNLGQLQPYDAVILGNVSKDALTDSQQRLIEANVHDMGAGLIMLGGPNSFGAGRWMNTPIEKALPVDMEIKALRVNGKSALVMIMHASEIAEGNYWMKVIAQEALKTLSSYDYAGMLHWEGQEAWLFTLREIASGRPSMLRAIDRMTPGDMPAFDPSLVMSMNALRRLPDAMTRHIIIISDGDPSPPLPRTVSQLVRDKITVTTVLTAAHGNDPGAIQLMRDLAQRTKGRFYNVQNPKALPRIYQKEARLISRPLIFERNGAAWQPTVRFSSEPLLGLPTALPGITGYVQTTLKEGAVVEAPIVSSLPVTGELNPLLAHWTYGLGRTVAWTSDAGRRWTKAWPDWAGYSAFWSQVVRWAMRPVDNRNLVMNVRQEEGRIKVVVDALDKENEFLNFLQFRAGVIGPDLKSSRFDLRQTAPGRYEGVVENAEASGNYFINLGFSGGDDVKGVISAGVSVPYSDEYRELRADPPTLENIAAVTNGAVLSWKKRADGEIDINRTVDASPEGDPFRRDEFTQPPRAFLPLWPRLLWLACLLFLADVAVRRLAPDFDRIRRTIAETLQRMRGEEVAPTNEYIEKLKSRKAEVDTELERSRAATRYEAPAARLDQLGEPLLGTPPAADAARPTAGSRPDPTAGGLAAAPSAQPESYTDRLLKAKQKVWEDRDKQPPTP
ncbi:MAG: glutamine amidotransferase [Isosphaeraceae bacterium]|nr:glutamine amidotransferase [Isosphaeraceae bacterium]